MATPDILQLQARKDIDGLIDALRYHDPTVRKGAAAALHVLGAWQAVPALQAALAVENDWQVHAAFTAALQYLDRDIHVERMIKEKDVRGLSKMLYSTKHEDVLTACNALGAIGDKRSSESLVMVFRNPLLPNNVRLAAAEALLKMDAAPAVVTLLGALRRDNWQIRRNAAAVLGQLQATWAVEPLVVALKDDNQAVRRTAAAALRRMGTPEALRALTDFEEAQGKSITQEVPRPDSSQVTPPPKLHAQIQAAQANPNTEPLPDSNIIPPLPVKRGSQTEPLPELGPEQPKTGTIPAPQKPQTGVLPDGTKPKVGRSDTTPLPPLQAAAEPKKPATGVLPPKVQTQRLQTGSLPIVLDKADATKPKATGILPKQQTDAPSAPPATSAPNTSATPDFAKATTESPSVSSKSSTGNTGDLKSKLQKFRDTQQMKKAETPPASPEGKPDEPPPMKDNSP